MTCSIKELNWETDNNFQKFVKFDLYLNIQTFVKNQDLNKLNKKKMVLVGKFQVADTAGACRTYIVSAVYGGTKGKIGTPKKKLKCIRDFPSL